MQDCHYELLYGSYFPFRLYAEATRGATVDQLALRYNLSRHWIEERVEAARLCIERQVRITHVEAA
jgi:hypothetical protein